MIDKEKAKAVPWIARSLFLELLHTILTVDVTSSSTCCEMTLSCADRSVTFVNPSPKYSSVFRENICPPPSKPVYGGHFSHEAVTLNIRSRSPKSNKQLILSDLFRPANLVTFHPMVHEITCRQTLFGLILVD